MRVVWRRRHSVAWVAVFFPLRVIHNQEMILFFVNGQCNGLFDTMTTELKEIVVALIYVCYWSEGKTI
jgi:hypothetical protein